MLRELTDRSQEVLRRLVEEFMETGQPVGSRTLSRRLATPVSPATVRNVMADLEDAGLLYAPHVSAGRLPTQLGLRIYVDGCWSWAGSPRRSAPASRASVGRRAAPSRRC